MDIETVIIRRIGNTAPNRKFQWHVTVDNVVVKSGQTATMSGADLEAHIATKKIMRQRNGTTTEILEQENTFLLRENWKFRGMLLDALDIIRILRGAEAVVFKEIEQTAAYRLYLSLSNALYEMEDNKPEYRKFGDGYAEAIHAKDEEFFGKYEAI